MTTRHPWILAAVLAIPLILTLGCDDDETGPDGTARVVATLDSDGGTVVVTEGDGGGPVSGATVALNGTAATPGASAGEYDVVLPAPVAAGGTMTLDVSNDEFVIQGTGTVPETPVITAPADDASFLPTEAIDVAWTSTSDPTGFVVVAEGATTEVFPVAGGGAARAHTIPSGTLANGDWIIRVRAANLGGFIGDTEAGSEMEIGAEAATPPEIRVGPALLRIQGSDMGPMFNHVSLTLAGSTVDGATVTVNGEAATQNAPNDSYHVTLAAPVAVGGQLDLDVTVGADVYQGLGNVPEPPVVTAPADAASFAAAAPIQVDWTSTADPDRFAIFVDGPVNFQELEIAGNLRTFTIPGGTFTAGSYTISVFSYEDGVFTGPADPASRMSIRGELGPFPEITVTP
jgi:hypothetical protein